MTSFAELTTFRVGGPIERFVEAHDEDTLVHELVALDAAGDPFVIIGGGSNLLCADAPYRGTVLAMRMRGIDVDESGDTVRITAAAGEPWDDLVALAVEREWAGIEALSGIPGLVGATPVQNVGAYGQEIAQVLLAVRVWDREAGAIATLSAAECEFAYRESLFKHSERYVILAVTFELARRAVNYVQYGQLASALGIAVGAQAPVARIRETVLALRREKGMVLDATDHDTWSAGSYFTNPIVSDDASIPEDCPRYPAAGGIKLSAAWLIENAGISKGFSIADGARVSTKHTLALTNAGGATAEGIRDLAEEITRRVRSAFGIELVPEPRLLGW